MQVNKMNSKSFPFAIHYLVKLNAMVSQKNDWVTFLGAEKGKKANGQ